jgi:hypothetical protein
LKPAGRKPAGFFTHSGLERTMNRLTLLSIILVLAIVQLWWFVSTWRKEGFGAAFKLCLFSMLSVTIGVLQELADSLKT